MQIQSKEKRSMESTIVMLLQFLPFLLILWLANMAEDRRHPRRPRLRRGCAGARFLVLGLIPGGSILSGLLVNLLSLMPVKTMEPAINFGLLGIAMWAPSLVGLLFFIPSMRRQAARL